jgi:thiamine transporter ThiT
MSGSLEQGAGHWVAWVFALCFGFHFLVVAGVLWMGQTRWNGMITIIVPFSAPYRYTTAVQNLHR